MSGKDHISRTFRERTQANSRLSSGTKASRSSTSQHQDPPPRSTRYNIGKAPHANENDNAQHPHHNLRSNMPSPPKPAPGPQHHIPGTKESIEMKSHLPHVYRMKTAITAEDMLKILEHLNTRAKANGEHIQVQDFTNGLDILFDQNDGAKAEPHRPASCVELRCVDKPHNDLLASWLHDLFQQDYWREFDRHVFWVDPPRRGFSGERYVFKHQGFRHYTGSNFRAYSSGYELNLCHSIDRLFRTTALHEDRIIDEAVQAMRAWMENEAKYEKRPIDAVREKSIKDESESFTLKYDKTKLNAIEARYRKKYGSADPTRPILYMGNRSKLPPRP